VEFDLEPLIKNFEAKYGNLIKRENEESVGLFNDLLLYLLRY
jgi:hypothetical protein